MATYKLSILGLFVAIMVVAFALSSYRYHQELAVVEQRELSALNNLANLVDNELNKALESLEAIKRFADYSLNFPKSLASMPTLKQEGERYYSDKTQHDILAHRQRLSVNITGIGQSDSFTANIEQELAMANMLTPAFIAAQNTVQIANWFSYLSLQRFISLYPWIDRQTWQYHDGLLEQEYFVKVKASSPLIFTPIWSQPYVGSATGSLSVALSSGVFREQQLTGAAMLSIDLAHIKQLILKHVEDDFNYVVINRQQQLLLHLNANAEMLNTPKEWHAVLPEALQGLAYDTLLTQAPSIRYQTESQHSDPWLIQHQAFAANDWMIVKYKRYELFSTPIFQRYTWFFIELFLGQLTLLLVVYFVTHKTFIAPTQRFIRHISHSAEGDHGKISPPKGWHHWFAVVGDIFSQNRSLLQQLKDQNNVLDLRVHEKTQALREKSQQHQQDYAILHSVMDAIPDYLIFNDTKGHLIGCNLAFEQFVGRAEQDILGTKVGTLIDNKLGRALLLCAEDFQAQKSRCGTFEVIETINNTYELFSSDFYNQAHQVLGSIVIIRDVTKQYAINSALENAKEQAELANKAKSQFLANMSHEIRTPINAIYGMQSLLRQTALTNQQLQQLTHAQDASVALLHLVDELLDLAKIESGNMSINKQNCVLDNAVNQAIKLNINNIDSEQVAFHVRIGSNVPSHVITDEMRLVQVLSNLLNNAIKFTHDGEISITIECLDKQTEQALVKFTVADTGIGIEKSKQQDLFKAFVQADESMTREYGGSGLGLSICQRIVNLLGGEIVLTSEFGVGSTFSFVLPFDYDAQAIQFEREQSINFFALQFEPPVEFTQLLTSYGYHYDALQCLSEVEQAPEAVINVLLVQVEQVNDSLCQSLSEQLACTHSNLTKDQQCLVMVYQTCQSMDINHHYDLLNQYQIPYVICEAPLYRYSLCNVLAELDEQALSAEQNGQTNAENVEKLPTEHKSLQGVSILLVEDNLVNQLVAKELLQSMQAKVTIVDNGQKAIDMLAQQEFDVVLMDIQMPVMDGLEATRLIRSESKYLDLPIIAMTAHARQEDKESSYAAGMNLHIAKPVTAELLLSSIQHVLSEVSMQG